MSGRQESHTQFFSLVITLSVSEHPEIRVYDSTSFFFLRWMQDNFFDLFLEISYRPTMDIDPVRFEVCSEKFDSFRIVLEIDFLGM